MVMRISQYRLVNDISVPLRRINEIVQGKRKITPDTASRLSRISAFQNDSGSILSRVMILRSKKTDYMIDKIRKRVSLRRQRRNQSLLRLNLQHKL